jgi:hypothetical protein
MPTQPQRLHLDANWYFGRAWAGMATRSMGSHTSLGGETNQFGRLGLDFYLPARPLICETHRDMRGHRISCPQVTN